MEGTRSAVSGQDPSFVQVYSALLLSGIPSDELHVWLVLRHYAGAKGYCWVSDRTLGEAIGRSQGTASRVVGRLEQRELVRRLKVEVTPENPTGRVLEVLGVVQPRASVPGQPHSRPPAPTVRQGVPQPRGRGAPKHDGPPAPTARHELHGDKKQHGPAACGVNPPARTEQEDRTRDALLRAAWVGTPGPVKAAIHAVVAEANPGLVRWPAMIDTLCLAELEARLTDGDSGLAFTVPAVALWAASCDAETKSPRIHKR